MYRRPFGPPWARRGWGGDWGGPQDPRFNGPRGFGPGFGPWGFGGPHHHHHHGGWQGYQPTPEQQALRSTAAEVARLFVIAGRSSMDNPEKQAQLRDFLERSRSELTAMIYGEKGNAAPTQENQNPNVEQA